MPRRRLISVCLLGVLLGTLAAPAAIGADSDYSLSLTDSIDTPPRTVTIQGDDHTVTSLGRTAPATTLSVAVTAPADATYDVHLYNGESKIEQSESGTGEKTIEFDLTGYEPGSYMLALQKDGDFKAVQPVVVRGYTVAVDDVPSQVDTDTEFTVSVTAEKVESVEDPESVKVVLATDDRDVEVTAAKASAQTYEATLSTDSFTPGDARIYAVVQGSDTAFTDDRQELLGVSDATPLSIYEPATTTTTSSPTTSTTSPSKTTATAETTATSATTTTTADPTNSASTTPPATSESTSRSTPTSTSDDSVITPNQSTTTTTPSPSPPSVPGFTPVSTILALLCAGLLAVRRYAQ